MKHKQAIRTIRQAGFSIVELMVAILIGLIILAGVVQVVITSKTTYLGQEEMSFIQENARYAMDVLSKDIQGAGYMGCAGANTKVAFVAKLDDPIAQPLFGVGALQGFKSDDASAVYNVANYDSESEALVIRRFAGQELAVSEHEGTTITLMDNHAFSTEQLVAMVAEDCRRVGVFRAGNVSGDKIPYTAINNYTTNIKPPLTDDIDCTDPDVPCPTYNQPYGAGAVAMDYQAHAYFIATKSSALDRVPALTRTVLNSSGATTTEEIALGVEDIQFRYAVRSGSNVEYKLVDAMTVNDWPSVVAVEVSLLMRAQRPNLNQDEERGIPGTGRTYDDRYIRQLVTSTFRIRNRS